MNVLAGFAPPLVLSTFGLIFLAELPDKTALTALVLATRYPARQVLAGTWLAFMVQTLVAVAAGGVLQVLPGQLVRVAAGLGFLLFALLAARRDVEEDVQEEEREIAREQRLRRPPWLVCFLVVFAAEWGDLTQLATAALVAETGQPLAVGIGATAALGTVALLAVVAGAQLGRYLRPRILKWVGVALFAIVGLVVLASAVWEAPLAGIVSL